MKKLAILLLFTMIFTGCGTTNTNIDTPIINSGNPIHYDNVKEHLVESEEFTLKLVSEKEEYKVGERINIHAELIYVGEEESVILAHAASPFWFYTTNLTEDYQFQSAMNEPLIFTTLVKNEPLIEKYSFTSGSYIEGQSGKAYDDDTLKKMSSLQFPPGQYKIEAKTDFSIDDLSSESVNLLTEIIITVTEK